MSDATVARTCPEKASQYRGLESARLDALQAAHWPAAMSADVKAADYVLHVSARRVEAVRPRYAREGGRRRYVR